MVAQEGALEALERRHQSPHKGQMSQSSTQVPQPDVDAALPVPPLLFSPGQIGVAAFFGSLLAAGWMARANWRALGQTSRGNLTLLAAAGLTLVIVGLACWLPEGVPGVAFTLPQVMLARQLSQSWFEGAMPTADQRSHWRVVGVVLGALVAFVVLAVPVAFAAEALGIIDLGPTN